MRERFVVCFRTELATTRDDELEGHLERARKIAAFAAALGGSIRAFADSLFAIEFLPDSLEKVLVLVGQASDEIANSPGAPPYRVGISQGLIQNAAEAGPLAEMAWGAPLVMASALSFIAAPGEVLLDPDMPAVEHGEIPTCGVSAGAYGELRVRGLLLDPLYVPALSSPVEEERATSRHPSVLPSQSSGPERRHGMEALSKGDLTEALLALRKGVEKTKSAPPVERAKALLAHSVALAAVGREYEAVLEALSALARAREAADRRGEEACARFLAKLSEGARQDEAALIWREVAKVRG